MHAADAAQASSSAVNGRAATRLGSESPDIGAVRIGVIVAEAGIRHRHPPPIALSFECARSA
jgi:hypothetical protein